MKIRAELIVMMEFEADSVRGAAAQVYQHFKRTPVIEMRRGKITGQARQRLVRTRIVEAK